MKKDFGPVALTRLDEARSRNAEEKVNFHLTLMVLVEQYPEQADSIKKALTVITNQKIIQYPSARNAALIMLMLSKEKDVLADLLYVISRGKQDLMRQDIDVISKSSLIEQATMLAVFNKLEKVSLTEDSREKITQLILGYPEHIDRIFTIFNRQSSLTIQFIKALFDPLLRELRWVSHETHGDPGKRMSEFISKHFKQFETIPKSGVQELGLHAEKKGADKKEELASDAAANIKKEQPPKPGG